MSGSPQRHRPRWEEDISRQFRVTVPDTGKLGVKVGIVRINKSGRGEPLLVHLSHRIGSPKRKKETSKDETPEYDWDSRYDGIHGFPTRLKNRS